MNQDNDNFSPEDVKLIEEAMTIDEQIDKLKKELKDQLLLRSSVLKKIEEKGHKRFKYKGTRLSIFRKNGGLWALRGKTKEDNDMISIE